MRYPTPPALLSAVMVAATFAPAVAQKQDKKEGGDRPAAGSALDVARELATTRFAGFTYTAKKPTKTSIDEQGFIKSLVAELAARSDAKLEQAKLDEIAKIMDLGGRDKKAIEAAMAKAVKVEDGKVTGFGEMPDWTRGIQKALVDAGLGVAVEPAAAQPGDIVQWWFQFKGGAWGTHVGVVEQVTKRGLVIFGAHRTTLVSEKKAKKKKGGIGTGPTLSLSKSNVKMFLVRFQKKS